MVCNCLTISSTSKLHQPGQMSNDRRAEQEVNPEQRGAACHLPAGLSFEWDLNF